MDDAMAKLRNGQFIMIRDGTAAHNLEALVDLLRQPYYDRCMFCTDDKHPSDLLEKGHIDYLIRKAIHYGIDPIVAVKSPAHCACCMMRCCPWHRNIWRTQTRPPIFCAEWNKLYADGTCKKARILSLSAEDTTDAAQQHRPEGGARSSPSSQTATSALKNATVKLTQLNTQFGESTVAFAAGRMESVLHSPV